MSTGRPNPPLPSSSSEEEECPFIREKRIIKCRKEDRENEMNIKESRETGTLVTLLLT
jgi:hypothetical protein